MRLRLLSAVVLVTGWCGAAVRPAPADDPPFVFRDAARSAGLRPLVEGIRGHGAAWGDVDADGWLDLYVATFHTDGSQPNLLFRNDKGAFRLDEQPGVRISTRGTGVVFADLDNDGDLDLYVGSMPAGPESRLAMKEGHPLAGCTLFRNDGTGRFTNVAKGNGACPPAFGGRSVAVLDYDGDGRLDLLVGEDPFPGYNGSSTTSSRLFRNLGELQFEDVSRKAGVPADIPGLGVAAGDVNNDGWPDIFLAANNGGNVLLLNDQKGGFREPPGSRAVFAWPATKDGDNMICGVSFGDVNRDGRLDIVLGPHYSRPWLEPMAVRLYLNRGIADGNPTFEDVTDKVGLTPLPMKAPHVEIQDYDNDGWPDISTSLVKFADGQPHPVIFRHRGVRDGLPRFGQSALAVNDFPTAEDTAIQRSGPFFEKMIAEGKVVYTAPGPSGDYDNDGRLDMFLPSWWPEVPSLLLHNETPSGHWLKVDVLGRGSINRMGIGSRINVYPAGKLGEAASLIGCREIATGYGYASGQPASAHFGLGELERVDVEIVLPHGHATLTRKAVEADQRITVAP